jgi:uncharacterized membrane protein YcfT
VGHDPVRRQGAGLAAELGAVGVMKAYFLAYVEPFGTLWFIYLLPIFFVVTKLTRFIPPILIFIAATVLEGLRVKTGWTVIDEFAARFVYFFAGYWLATHFFALAQYVADSPRSRLRPFRPGRS